MFPLSMALGSTLPKPSASQSSDSSPRKAVADRTRKKTNATEIIDEEWTQVKGRMEHMRERLIHVNVQGQRNEIEEKMESYVMLCEKAIESGKPEDLPKIFGTKFDEEKCGRQGKALPKARSPEKEAETAMPTRTITITSSSTFTMGAVSRKGKDEGGEYKRQKGKKGDAEEVEAIESDVEATLA